VPGGEKLFNQPTVQLLEPQPFDAISRAYLKQYPKMKKTLEATVTENNRRSIAWAQRQTRQNTATIMST